MSAISTGLDEIERGLDASEDAIAIAAWRTRHVHPPPGMPSFASGLRRLVRSDLGRVRRRLDRVPLHDRDRLLARVAELEVRLDEQPSTRVARLRALAFCVAMVLVACVARSCAVEESRADEESAS